MAITLDAQLLISFIAAAAVAIALPRHGFEVLAVAAATIVGMLLTLTIQRTLWLVHLFLARLGSSQAPSDIPLQWHGPLSSLVGQMKVQSTAAWLRPWAAPQRTSLLKRMQSGRMKAVRQGFYD